MTTYKIGDKEVVHPDGFEWGAYPFGKNDWGFIGRYIVENNVKNVLEIGSGLSSLLLSQLCHIDTLENNNDWCKKLQHFIGRAKTTLKKDNRGYIAVYRRGKREPLPKVPEVSGTDDTDKGM